MLLDIFDKRLSILERFDSFLVLHCFRFRWKFLRENEAERSIWFGGFASSFVVSQESIIHVVGNANVYPILYLRLKDVQETCV
jgi:hypothetical protein